jgi:hypothetical protein
MKPLLSRLTANLSASLLVIILSITLIITTRSARACACGCGVFDVGTLWNLPSGSGGMVYTQYAFSEQSQNWHNMGPSAANNNDDRLIQTSWLTYGFQYFFNNKWGVEIQLPTANRLYYGNSAGGNSPTTTLDWFTMGDIRVMGYYTGFSPDMSTGLQFGLKLPTGYWGESGNIQVDLDTQIGTGSTDILLGFYTHHPLTQDRKWNWFVQSLLDLPVYGQGGYHPGTELDSAAGIYYDGLRIGRVGIQPLGQILVSNRASDTGPAADPQDSGYQRILLSPGFQIDIHPIRIYADVEFPVFNDVVGQQLISQCLVKMNVSYMF